MCARSLRDGGGFGAKEDPVRLLNSGGGCPHCCHRAEVHPADTLTAHALC